MRKSFGEDCRDQGTASLGGIPDARCSEDGSSLSRTSRLSLCAFARGFFGRDQRYLVAMLFRYQPRVASLGKKKILTQRRKAAKLKGGHISR